MYTIITKLGIKREIIIWIADDLWIPFSDRAWVDQVTYEEAGQILGGN